MVFLHAYSPPFYELVYGESYGDELEELSIGGGDLLGLAWEITKPYNG
jgi:hypothetical protein